MQNASSSKRAGIVGEAASRLEVVYGRQLLGLYELQRPLFADDEECPDFQLVALLTGSINVYDEIARISEHASNLSIEYDAFISIYPIGERDLASGDGRTPMGLRPSEMHRVA